VICVGFICWSFIYQIINLSNLKCGLNWSLTILLTWITTIISERGDRQRERRSEREREMEREGEKWIELTINSKRKIEMCMCLCVCSLICVRDHTSESLENARECWVYVFVRDREIVCLGEWEKIRCEWITIFYISVVLIKSQLIGY